MSGVITLGPLVLAVDRLLAVGTIGLFLVLVDLIGRVIGRPTARAAWIAILVGFLAARIAFIWVHRAAYAEDWLSIFAVWQGGFDVQVGAFAAGAALLATLQTRRAGLFGFGAVLFCFLLFTVGTILTRPASRPLPPVEGLRTLDGRAASLERYHGEPFIINLWATWCGPCRRELPMLTDVARRTTTPILLVDVGEDAETVRAFLARERLGADAILLDQRGALARALNSSVYPTTLFVDRHGRIVDVFYGEMSRAGLLERLAALGDNGR